MNKIIFIGVSVLSFAGGSVSGYLYAQKILMETFDRQLSEQIQKEMAATYRNKDRAEDALRAAQRKLEELEGEAAKPTVVDLADSEKVFYNNVLPAVREFTDRLRPPVPAREAMAAYQGLGEETKIEPSMDRPYQINDAMFQEGVSGYDQIQLTYYAGDGVLADDRDDVIEDPLPMVGPDFQNQFGQMSGDPNVVFIRNGLREIDFEITRSEGKYGEEVAGERPNWLPDHRGEDG